MTEEEAYNELCGYTLNRGGSDFIHQHVVDAYAAQHAEANSKPITLTFALVGLYLLIERQFTGRQVQLAHMKMGRQKHTWPAFMLPADRGSITAVEVLAAPAGPERDRLIHEWCASVWNAFAGNRDIVAALLREHGI